MRCTNFHRSQSASFFFMVVLSRTKQTQQWPSETAQIATMLVSSSRSTMAIASHFCLWNPNVRCLFTPCLQVIRVQMPQFCGPNSYRFLLERAIKGKFCHLNWRYQNYASSLQILDLTEFPERIGQKKGNVLSCGCSSGCGSGHGFRTESGWFLAGISKPLSI
jgi:hypothetical protein